MRQAPPADAPIASGRLERMLIALCHALALGAGAYALTPALWGVDMPLWVCVPLAGLAAAIGACTWQSVGGQLRWDGQQWHWLATSAPAGPAQALANLRVQIDLGSWVLLRWRADKTARRHTWACLRAGDAGPRWHGMRVALVAWSRQAAKPQAATPQAGRRA